jgi:glycosyltransferase involved in cell wall biosynthesis
MKQIAYLCLSKGWGGLEMNQIRNAKAMQDRGHNVLILTLDNSATLFEAQQQNLPYYTFEKKPTYYQWFFAWQIARNLSKQNIKHLFFRNNREMSLAASIAFFSFRKIKVHYFMEMALGGRKTQWFRTLRYTFYSTWSCPLPYLVRQVHENARVSKSKINLIPSGFQFIKGASPDQNSARFKLKWPEKSKLLVVVGRLDPKKRQDFVWDMFSKRQDENEYLIFVGASTADEAPVLETDLRIKINAHPKGKRVLWAGFQNDMQFVYAAADLIIMPSAFETFGMATLEALSMGCPVVGSNTGGTSELLELYGGGLTFENQSQEDLSEQIDQVLKGAFPAVKIEQLKQHFSFEHVCEQIENKVLI